MRHTPYYIIGIVSLTALLLLTVACDSCRGADMRQQLASLDSLNRSDSPLTDDSLAQTLAEYFDRHGTDNERMKAHYLLGRTHYDRGELPAALDAYHTAADCADTTAADCDYRTLCRVHAQTADLLYHQFLPYKQIEADNKAMYYAMLAKDTLAYIACISMLAEAYNLIHKQDTALMLFKKAYDMYTNIGHHKGAATVCCSLANVLCEQNQFEEADDFLRIYEQSSGYFDNTGNICKGREVYYYVKGLYYLGSNDYKKAEYCFRKELYNGFDNTNQYAARKGLLMLYVKQQNVDSICKYIQLTDSITDSSHLQIEMQSSLQLEAFYDYSQHKAVALEKTAEAEHAKAKLHSVIIVTLLFLLFLFLIAVVYVLLLMKYHSVQENLAKAQSDYEDLSTASNSLISRKEQEILQYQHKINQYKRWFFSLKRLIVNQRLAQSEIVISMKKKASHNPPLQAEISDFNRLRMVINHLLPSFYSRLNANGCPIASNDYRICMLIRAGIGMSDISRLMGISPSSVTKTRVRLLKQIYQREGKAEDFDQEILAILD